MTKILLVEDDPSLRDMYQEHFKIEGFNVLATADGSKAIDLAIQEKPSIILLDIMLPGIDGFEVLAEIRDHPDICDTPVLILTNYGDSISQDKGWNAGTTDFLLKVDHTPESIAEKIRDILIMRGEM